MMQTESSCEMTVEKMRFIKIIYSLPQEQQMMQTEQPSCEMAARKKKCKSYNFRHFRLAYSVDTILREGLLSGL